MPKSVISICALNLCDSWLFFPSTFEFENVVRQYLSHKQVHVKHTETFKALSHLKVVKPPSGILFSGLYTISSAEENWFSVSFLIL